jgi:hypothetical protein
MDVTQLPTLTEINKRQVEMFDDHAVQLRKWRRNDELRSANLLKKQVS